MAKHRYDGEAGDWSRIKWLGRSAGPGFFWRGQGIFTKSSVQGTNWATLPDMKKKSVSYGAAI